MLKLYSTDNKKFLKQVNKSEAELNRFLSENWKEFFPHFTFIKNEFSLDGNVRSKGGSGRIDILAYNPKSKKFVIFELKKDADKNIRHQASDYRDFIENNFAEIYLLATQTFDVVLPKFNEISKDDIELILIAKSFSATDVDKAKKSKGEITLIKYLWFENQLLLIDYLNNDPDDLIEKENAVKLQKIKNIIDNRPELADVEAFLYGKEEAKRLFKIFYEHLKNLGEISVEAQASKIKVVFGNQTFSVIGYAGKTGKKCFLVINTNLDEVISLGEIVDDRVRPDGKKKGSIGSERYEVFLTTEEELMKFLLIIENNFHNGNN
ncbi:hypothetical protein CHU92_02065 [Flavobacterium cyanobacteriorum]|uniref:DUF5655 domain-containing protein n=1 Tax=Flavobacterium cyanobacteriorum TaxID=2022802 RepID=A0A255ZV75_9FLAO|nr:hypothetical protein [Flavobacterium cyanobacteriorum]OYQ45311.1 hypothetical protein CHU92_02065 [Flavobacterium cyanobacteriorum]